MSLPKGAPAGVPSDVSIMDAHGPGARASPCRERALAAVFVGSRAPFARSGVSERFMVVACSTVGEAARKGVRMERADIEARQEHALYILWGFPGGASGKELPCQGRRHKRCRFSPLIGKIQVLFIYFCPGWVFIAAHRLTLGKQAGTSL